MTILWSKFFESADIALVLVAAVGVLLCLLPGVAMFYGSRDGSRSTAFTQRWIELPIVLSLAWGIWIYSLAFAPSWGTLPDSTETEEVYTNLNEMAADAHSAEAMAEWVPFSRVGTGGVIGGTDFVALQELLPMGDDREPNYPTHRPAYELPHALLMVFQLSLFLAAAFPFALVLSLRIRWEAVLFTLIAWGTLVYAPIAHAVWGSGWLQMLGAIDSSGGFLHIIIGFSALACTALPRRPVDDDVNSQPIDSYPPLSLGVLLIWGGLLLAQVGCVYSAGPKATTMLLNGLMASSAGGMSWLIMSYVLKSPALQALPGAGLIAGLAAIAGGAGFVATTSAFVIGLAGGVLASVFFAMLHAKRPVDGMRTIFVLHGLPGVIGVALTGVFLQSTTFGSGVTTRVAHGLITGDARQLGWQSVALAFCALWSFAATWLLLKFVAQALNLLFSHEIQPVPMSEKQPVSATISGGS